MRALAMALVVATCSACAHQTQREIGHGMVAASIVSVAAWTGRAFYMWGALPERASGTPIAKEWAVAAGTSIAFGLLGALIVPSDPSKASTPVPAPVQPLPTTQPSRPEPPSAGPFD